MSSVTIANERRQFIMTNFLGKSKKRKYTIIVGCGRLGANIANTLSEAGEEVLIIDSTEKSFRKLSPSYGGIAVKGNALEMLMRGECDIRRATAVIAVTDQDNTNIMAAQVAKEMYHVDKVIARLYDPERQCVYKELGIKTICPVVSSTNEVQSMINETAAGVLS